MTKNEKLRTEQAIVKNTRDIINLLKNKKVKEAFIKYETALDFIADENLRKEFKNYVYKELKRNNYSHVTIDGFLCTHTNYREGKISAIVI